MDAKTESAIIATLLDAADEQNFPALWRRRSELAARIDSLLESHPQGKQGAAAPKSLQAIMRVDSQFFDEVVLAVSAEACSTANERLQPILNTSALTEDETRGLRDELQSLIESIPRPRAVDDWDETIQHAGGPLAALDVADLYAREHAIGILARQRMGSADVSLLRRLAELALSETEPAELRFCAYDALFVIAGKHPNDWPMTKVMSMSLSSREQRAFKASGAWLADANWEFVRSLRDCTL